MPPKKEGSKDSKTKPKLKRAANGFVMALKVPLGEVLTDMCKKKWVVGPPIGQGGFGTIYSGTHFGKFARRQTKFGKVNAPFSLFGVTLFRVYSCFPGVHALRKFYLLYGMVLRT